MAFNNFLVKIGNYTIPGKYIREYKAYKSVQDMDTYYDGNGVLHRNALEHTPHKIEIDIVPMLTEHQLRTLLDGIQSNYTIPKERKGNVTAFIPEEGNYVTAGMYMPDFTPEMYGIFNGIIYYKTFRIAFIEY